MRPSMRRHNRAPRRSVRALAPGSAEAGTSERRGGSPAGASRVPESCGGARAILFARPSERGISRRLHSIPSHSAMPRPDPVQRVPASSVPPGMLGLDSALRPFTPPQESLYPEPEHRHGAGSRCADRFASYAECGEHFDDYQHTISAYDRLKHKADVGWHPHPTGRVGDPRPRTGPAVRGRCAARRRSVGGPGFV
jgi:hypothetical protein